MGFGGGESAATPHIPAGGGTGAAPVSTGGSGTFQAITSLVGAGAKFAGGFLGAENQFTAAKAESTLMRAEADIFDFNADLARKEGLIAERDRDIEIDQHRDSVRRILGKQATFFAWGNIDLGDPTGTPAQIRLRSLYNAEYNEGIIIERGFIKKQQAKGKADIFEFQASNIRSGAPVVEAAGRTARAASLISLTGELLKDTGVLK